MRQDKFTWTAEEEKERHSHSQGESASKHLGVPQPLFQEKSAQTLASTGFYCLSGHITLRMVLIYYAQVPLVLIENKGEDVANHIKKEGYLQM